MMKVSVLVLSYNHEQFIQQTLESILNQKTSFEFEVLIGDDCSTDKSREVIEELYRLFPDRLKKIYPSQNLGPNNNYVNCFKNSNGKYIAFCEGDDYWIDTLKLQKQVDFLEKHNQYGGVCGEVVAYDVEKKREVKYPLRKKGKMDFNTIVRQNAIHSNTTLFRRTLVDLDSLNSISNLSIGDWYLHLLVTQKKPYYYLSEYFSLYRVHKKGVFSKKTDFYRSFQKAKLLHIFKKLDALEDNYDKIRESMSNQIFRALKVASKNDKPEVKKLFKILWGEKIIGLNRSILKGVLTLLK